MVLLLNPYKDLIITKNTVIYQGENAADKILFLLPEKFSDLELVNFTWTVKYVDAANISHLEVLDYIKDETLEVPILYNANENGYTQYLQYVLPIDSELTKFSGYITMTLDGVYQSDEIVGTTTDEYNREVNIYKTYKLKSNTLQIKITDTTELFTGVSDAALSSLDEKIVSINRMIENLTNVQRSINVNTPDDVMIDADSKLHLTANGETLGQGVEISVGVLDLDNNPEDGIITLSEISEDATSDDINHLPDNPAIIDL